MATQKELDNLYMNVAQSHSQLSKASRLQVGACLVTTDSVMLGGVNGQPRELGNICEQDGATKLSVVHAELNCVLKAAREGVSVKGSTMYVTHSPCESCASMLISAGVRRVVFKDEYRSLQGVELLLQAGVVVDKF